MKRLGYKRLPISVLGLAGLAAGCATAKQGEVAPETHANPVSSSTKTTTPVAASAEARLAKAPPKHREEVPNGVQSPDGITVPRGFQISVFAEGLTNPRRLAIAPGGTAQKYDVFVAESSANRLRVLRQTNGQGKAAQKYIYTTKLDQPYGIAFHPAGYVYVANTSNVVRFPYKSGSNSTDAEPQQITKLTEGGYNQHWTRNLAFADDFKKLYVTVGSSCNTCEEDDSQRAAISVMNPDGSGRRLFATGLRNPVGMAWRPASKELWTVVNERDNLGDDVPPDYLTHVKDGAFYGWPYAYTTIDGIVKADPSFGDKNRAKVKNTVAPDVPVQAHSAALGVAFYPVAASAKQALTFPAEYRGDAFLAFHGSWNRSAKTGYKIVRVNFEKGRPVEVTDFARGFLKNEQAWGRPVDVAVAPDGSLLFSDDDGGRIWRISYTGK